MLDLHEVLAELARREINEVQVETGATLAGPGVDIVSARVGGGLIAYSGTSMATPHVAGVAALARQPLISYESSTRPNSSLQRAFAANGLVPDLALTALDADLIKTYVRTGLGVGLLAEMAVSSNDEDLRSWPAPDPISECIAWAVLPRDRVLRDYALELVHVLAP